MKDEIEKGNMKRIYQSNEVTVSYCRCGGYSKPHIVIDTKGDFKVIEVPSYED